MAHIFARRIMKYVYLMKPVVVQTAESLSGDPWQKTVKPGLCEWIDIFTIKAEQQV